MKVKQHKSDKTWNTKKWSYGILRWRFYQRSAKRILHHIDDFPMIHTPCHVQNRLIILRQSIDYDTFRLMKEPTTNICTHVLQANFTGHTGTTLVEVDNSKEREQLCHWAVIETSICKKGRKPHRLNLENLSQDSWMTEEPSRKTHLYTEIAGDLPGPKELAGVFCFAGPKSAMTLNDIATNTNKLRNHTDIQSASPESGSRTHIYGGPLLHCDMQRSKAPHTTLLWVRMGFQPLLRWGVASAKLETNHMDTARIGVWNVWIWWRLMRFR